MTKSWSLDPDHTDHPTRDLGEHGAAHGKASSWAVVAVALVAFAAGGVSLIAHDRIALYVSAAVFVLCVPAGALLKIMDDTVAYTAPPPPHRRATK